MNDSDRKWQEEFLNPQNIQQARREVHRLVDKITSPGVLHRVYMILTRAYNVQ